MSAWKHPPQKRARHQPLQFNVLIALMVGALIGTLLLAFLDAGARWTAEYAARVVHFECVAARAPRC